MGFQSTRPLRGATGNVKSINGASLNFNPRAPYGARLRIRAVKLAELHFNPRAPYGARLIHRNAKRGTNYFNPRAPYGARRVVGVAALKVDVISIHAPLTGRDADAVSTGDYTMQFQSTRPLRGATIVKVDHGGAPFNFNPRAPYGARQQKCTNNLLHFCYNRQFKQKIHLYSIVCQNAIPLHLGIYSPNWVRTYLVFFVRLLFAPKQLDHQRIFRHICLFTAEMLDVLFILLP